MGGTPGTFPDSFAGCFWVSPKGPSHTRAASRPHQLALRSLLRGPTGPHPLMKEPRGAASSALSSVATGRPRLLTPGGSVSA